MSRFAGKNDPISDAEKAEGDMTNNLNGSLAPKKSTRDTSLLPAFFRTLLELEKHPSSVAVSNPSSSREN
jgi:hypothetical protein